MKFLKIAVLSLALATGWGAGPAAAASIDYVLTIPLADIDADSLAPTASLIGTLSYDDATSWGVGTFSLVGLEEPVSDTFSGNTWLLPLGDDATGIFFDGYTSDDTRLFFNIVASLGANTIVSDPVNYCTTGCALFSSIGATMTVAALPDGIASPGPVVSPVPLPPAASLFGAALLGLCALGAGRRIAPWLQPVRPRRPNVSGTACTSR